MPTTIETVETLTTVVAKQAIIIGKLCSALEQLNAVTSLDEEIEQVNALAEKALREGGGHSG